jgi:hypothetical protein
MLSIKKIFLLGKGYAFPRPPNCLREGCRSGRIWGHGYVDVWLEGYDKAICLKRYICADCGCVYTIRPFGYWPRHHVTVKIIFGSICHRVRHGVWEKGAFTRQRQGNWLRALRRNIKAYLGMNFIRNVLEGFYELLHRGKMPVFRAA